MGTHCLVCMEWYPPIKVLKCGHSFCLRCIIRLHNQSPYDFPSHRQPLQCPSCRAMVTQPLDNLPTNLTLQQGLLHSEVLAEVSAISSQSVLWQTSLGAASNASSSFTGELDSNMDSTMLSRSSSNAIIESDPASAEIREVARFSLPHLSTAGNRANRLTDEMRQVLVVLGIEDLISGLPTDSPEAPLPDESSWMTMDTDSPTLFPTANQPDTPLLDTSMNTDTGSFASGPDYSLPDTSMNTDAGSPTVDATTSQYDARYLEEAVDDESTGIDAETDGEIVRSTSVVLSTEFET